MAMRGWRAGGPALVLLVSLFWASFEQFATADDLKVRAMTFNIRLSKANDGADGWEKRRDQVRDLIHRCGADFVGLQEACPDQVAYLHEALPDYGHLTRCREADPSQGEAVPLFYSNEHWQLDCAQHGTFWLSDTPEVPGSKTWGNIVPRVVTWGRFLHKPTGRGVYVFNAHFDHLSERSRVRSAALLAQRIATRLHPDPVIVLGDLNSGERGGAVRYLKGLLPGSPTPLIDTFRTLHPNGVRAGTFHGFTGITFGAKIDYVFTQPDARVLDARILREHRDGRYPSDHFPVIAELAFPDRNGKPD